MASLEIVALDTITPQLRAPGGTDTYSVPKDAIMTDGKGIYVTSVAVGLRFDGGNGRVVFVTSGGTDVLDLAPTGLRLLPGGAVTWGAGLSSPDAGLARTAAKVLKFTDGVSGSGCLQLPTFTVATLPAAATAGAGARSTVSDGSVVAAGNFGAIVAGAGANIVPVYSDGTNWRIG